MSKETNRRDFIGYSFAAVAAVGGAASLVGSQQFIQMILLEQKQLKAF